MRKVISIVAALQLISCATPSMEGLRQKQLPGKYPYSIIGEDYGLLTEEDLATSSCVARAEPFSIYNLTSHPYWQCFSLKGSAFECDDHNSEPGEDPVAILAIVLKKDNATHEYLSRRAIPLAECKTHATEWARLTAKQGYICMSGQFINPSKDAPDTKNLSWIFESYKTSKGCDSYFEGGCNLAYKIKNGCDLAEMTRTEDRR